MHYSYYKKKKKWVNKKKMFQNWKEEIIKKDINKITVPFFTTQIALTLVLLKTHTQSKRIVKYKIINKKTEKIKQ